MSRCWGSHAICLIKETKHEFLLYYHLDVFVGSKRCSPRYLAQFGRFSTSRRLSIGFGCVSSEFYGFSFSFHYSALS